MENHYEATATDHCEKCVETPGWEAVVRDGRVLMKACVCAKERAILARAKALVGQSGLRGSLLEKTFDNYRPRTKKQEEVLKTVRLGGSFFLIGPWGCGKTHLLAASVNQALAMGEAAAFFSAPWLMKMIREDMLNADKNEVLEKCCEVPYLAVDDLGKEKPTETVQQVLFMIFDRREIGGRRTSVTSNLMPDSLAKERLDGAIVDRIMGMCQPIVIDGESYRRKK